MVSKHPTIFARHGKGFNFNMTEAFAENDVKNFNETLHLLMKFRP